MKKFEVSYQEDQLVIHVNGLSNDIIMSWQGISDIMHPEYQLGAFLDDLLPNLSARILKIDLSNFDYMNSATFGPFLQFVKNLDRNMISTEILFNSKKEWQRITFRCLKMIARSLKHILVEMI